MKTIVIIFLDSFEGKTYLAILGKVLVFLLVFRSKLAFDRFWSGRQAYGGITSACEQIVRDTSVFFEDDSEEQKKCRSELYRLALASMMCMTIRKFLKSQPLTRSDLPNSA